jgi:MFS family permease
MGVATLIISALAGWLVNAGNTFGLNDKLGFQLVFVLSFMTGMVSTFAFSRIIEPKARVLKPGEGEPAGGRVAAMLRSPGFVGLVISAFVWNFSLQIAAPFFNVYLVTNLGAEGTMVGIATAASSLTGLLGLMIFGRLMDRKGAVWLQIVTGFPIVVLPILWAFYTDPYQVVVNNLFGGFLWAGYNLASFNLLLQLTLHHQRAHAVAFYQTAVFSSAVLGPLVGGYVADNIMFQYIFILSGIGRFVAMIIFVLLTALPIHRMAQQKLAASRATK